MKLQETQEYLKDNLDGFIASSIVDAVEGLPLAGAAADPNFDLSTPAGMYTDTFQSAKKAFEVVGWGIPNEILIPGDPNTAILISLGDGRYYQGIAISSKTPLGMVRAIFNKVKPEIEKLLP